MLPFFSRGKPANATINGRTIAVLPRETLLTAALRNGMAFPHGCRVGGCAGCKCRLVQGRVRQLRSASYILSDQDLDAGCILACQSVPHGDVRIEVDMAAAARRSRARVLSREPLTHDIVRLRVQLEEALPYRAGQFAMLAFDALPGVERSYSFASPAAPDGQALFFIRQVPGGVFSSFVHGEVLAGEPLSVTGPLGDFWLRPGAAPLLMVAGGSGLAPVLAMLAERLGERDARPVALLLGARTQQDLYEQEAIAGLQAQWQGAFTYRPVLSAEPCGSGWPGARGLVADFVAEHDARNADAYLCGPPAMVDAVQRRLLALGAAPARIRADRFTTLNEAPAV
ncbi:2Fe-2S iron-sulfur cluster-binding protein [Xylophilus sp. ASV27]|uniref:2Fe-2S iron-sulfur cluster-binding protein n=1 Tax=Xylophilus sp. ASV27 TaxID=2795129 RepID=UPI0018ED92A1|nr:2Fe-2S iron-sulfur cluster binding domain-containing protein [Xylophilus sp. ASV27]